MIGHTGYFPCFYCHIRGIHSREARKRQYPFVDHIDYRTVKSFRENSKSADLNQMNTLGHLGRSILDRIVDIPLPNSILIDYCHVSLLRHFREILRILSKRLSPADRKTIDTKLRQQRFPHYFGRKMRGIEDLSYIKAVELKNLLLYGFIPHFIPYLNAECMSFVALFVMGIRLLHSDKPFAKETSAKANLLLSIYYADNHLFFRHQLNFVLHLHRHYARLYEQNGPLSSINTFAQEDFLGYISKNRNGARYFDNLIPHYYNLDVYLQRFAEEKNRSTHGKTELRRCLNVG